jgi:hypothetical protein
MFWDSQLFKASHKFEMMQAVPMMANLTFTDFLRTSIRRMERKAWTREVHLEIRICKKL